jgi:MinD-like ATPase involved in chromosome partitioning or flagellar assembly
VSRTGVLCALRGSAETAVARGIGADRALDVTRRCADLPELLAGAAAGLGSVAVISTDVPGLDRDAIAHLHAHGVWVVAVLDAAWSDERARALGVDRLVEPGDPAVTAPAAVHLVLAEAGQGRRPGSPGSGGAPTPLDGVPEVATSAHGRLVAVWGPTGAPGRTTVAVNLAAELAGLAEHGRHANATTLLVDADTYGGTVAQALGLLDEAPGIAAAARAAGTGRLDASGLAALTPLLECGLRVLTGISRPDRWPELPAASLDVVWRVARELAAWTVVDCGFAVEQDEALSYDTRAPRRNAATLSALADADVVVVVGAGDPIGLQRLVRALADLGELGLGAERRVVVNRVRASASGTRPRDAVREALRRYAGVTDARVVADDQISCDGALLHARTLAEHAPTSPVRRALADLAAELLSLGVAAGAH